MTDHEPALGASSPSGASQQTPLPIVRSAIGGVLMGMANLVPGVSGGTMILVVGLYDEFISSVADVTRLRFTRRNILFLGIVGVGALVAIGSLAGTLRRAVTLHESAMFSLFIGLTLGGVPLLCRMLKRPSPGAIIGAIVGLAMMVAMAQSHQAPPPKEAVREAVASGEFVVEANYTRDAVAGVLGMSAMVLPGISGAYMLLILDRYEPILASVSMAKHYATSFGAEGDPATFLRVLIPVALGSLLSLVALSNLLKWLLHRHPQPTLGLLLGIVLGSVVGIWPFSNTSDPATYALGGLLAIVGFATTLLLSRISA